ALAAVTPDADPEPVGGLDPLAGLLVLRRLVDRDREARHGPPVRGVAKLGVAPEVADDLDLAQRHLLDSRSVDRGRSRLALRLVDPLATIILFFLVLRGRKRRLVGVARAGVATRASWPFLADDKMAQDLLGDQDPALELGDDLGRRLEDHDVVGALAVAV